MKTKYKFVLDTEIGVFILDEAPLEWAKMKVLLKRDPIYKGIFPEFILDKLTFIGVGKDKLKELFDTKGIFAKATLRVYYLSKTTFEYKKLPTDYKLDFNVYFFENNQVKINALPLGILADLRLRENFEIDVTKLKSVGEFQIQDYENLKKFITFPEIKGYYIADFLDENYNLIFLTSSDQPKDSFFTFPMTNISSDFFVDEIQNIPFGEWSSIDATDGFFYFSEENRVIEIKGDIDLDVLQFVGGAAVLINIVRIDDNDVRYDNYIPFVNVVGKQIVHIDETITVNKKDSLVLYCRVIITGSSYPATVEIAIKNSVKIKISDAFIETPQRTVEGFPLYELNERALQIICDKQFPFYSEYLGREDVKKNLTEYYSSENQLRFAHILNGLNIRGAKLDNINNNLAITFKKLWKTENACYNLALGLKEVDGDYRIEIERFQDFFLEEEGLDLSGRIDEIKIKQESAAELLYAQISTGWNKNEYEENNGRGEYNGKNERLSTIPSDNKFDNVCDFRGDTKGMTTLLTKPFSTEDVKGDDDVFIVKTQRDSDDWKAETDENIQILDDSSLFQEGSLNLYFTPTRNLLRHKQELATGLDKKANSKLTFQTGSNLQTLKTTDGFTVVTENEDLRVHLIMPPKFDYKFLIAEIPFYEEDFEILKDNLKKYITLSDNLKGWLWGEGLEWNMTKNTATIKLIKKWL